MILNRLKLVQGVLITAIICNSVLTVRGQQDSCFVDLLAGNELSQWTALETLDPRKFEALSDDERQKLLDDGRTAMQKFWTMDGNELVNEGEGPYLTTLESYRDFELKLEYRTVAKADSGIYLKATPQIQIWDSTEEGGKWDIGADKGSGGLWNNSPGAAGKDPLVLADRPFGEWNRVRVVQVGQRTSVWLNDQLVVDHALMENYWGRELPLVCSGPIQLQTHGGEIRWRNIHIRELSTSEANNWLESHAGNGFKTAFDGVSFAGWQGPTDNYEIVDGALRCLAGKGGTIYTETEYGDFDVCFEFKLPPGGNNGLAIRYPGEGDTAYVGMCELQVLDSEHEKYATLDQRQYHGSAYGMVPAHRGYLRETGDWNFQRVTVKGATIAVELNGTLILNCNLAEVSEFMADRPHPGKDRVSGHFGFAGHNDPVEFRNIKIKSH
ncbi:MAG: DUF1080 domain-containing protein [Pirellulaceae bacterium]